MNGIITKITTQKNNKERFNIYVDKGQGEEYGFSVDQDVLIKFQLKKGKQLDDFELEDIFFEDEIKKAFQLAVHYLSYKMRSTKEVIEYLRQKETNEPIIREVLHKLEYFRYINDEEYALAFVRTQKNTTDKGPEIIKKELIEKGIEPILIEKSMEQYSESEQIDTLIKVCEKFLKKDKKLSKREQKAKLEQLCVRKGFPLSLLEIALSEVKVEKDDTEWDAICFHGEKLHRKYKHLQGWEYRQKMKQSLYRKGFPLELIEKFLNSRHEEG